MKKITTVCIVHKDSQILLGMKKQGFGKGRWNGFGGKVKADETVEEATKRELSEEAGIQAEKIERIGIIEFSFQEIPDVLENHFFRAVDFSGEISETKEMKPKWFHVDDIPFDQMWPDDIYWMPLFLTGKKFKGKILFDKPSTENYSSKIIDKKIEIVNSL